MAAGIGCNSLPGEAGQFFLCEPVLRQRLAQKAPRVPHHAELIRRQRTGRKIWLVGQFFEHVNGRVMVGAVRRDPYLSQERVVSTEFMREVEPKPAESMFVPEHVIWSPESLAFDVDTRSVTQSR